MIMYFFDYAGQSDTYFLNVGHVFGENMDRLHKLQNFNTFNGNDIDKLIANNTQKNIYIISWGEPVLNTTTEKAGHTGRNRIFKGKTNQYYLCSSRSGIF